MKAIYTTCSYNHIGRAFSLGDSVKQFAPDCQFFIGIIDQLSGKGPDERFQFITAKEIGIPYFAEMCAKYGPMELSSALKPFFADHIFTIHEDITELVYLDSDILVFNSLQVIYDCFSAASIVLTPHTFSTISSGNGYDDRNFLRCGIYNAGFFGVKNDANGFAFLHWWMGKLRNEGFYDSKRGMFADQLWLNLVPIYFEKVQVLEHRGCNVAYWNLHERMISKVGNTYYVNNDQPLIFYHFSGAAIDCLASDRLSQHHATYSFTDRPDVRELFAQYLEALKKNQFENYSSYYTISSTLKTRSALLVKFFRFYKSLLKRFVYVK